MKKMLMLVLFVTLSIASDKFSDKEFIKFVKERSQTTAYIVKIQQETNENIEIKQACQTQTALQLINGRHKLSESQNFVIDGLIIKGCVEILKKK